MQTRQVDPRDALPALANGKPLPPRKLTAALVGNPNTGKTTLFNALSGLRQHVGNYPGVTVETKKGQMCCAGRTFDLIDLPGTYSLAPRSPDEMVAVDVILGQQKGEARPDVVVSIVDASNLERNLYLTTQALELGVPVVVALNMMDVAESQGIRIDIERLSRQFGVPVVPIQANKKKGLEQLRAAVAMAATNGPPPRQTPFPEAFEREVAQLHQALGVDTPIFLIRRLVLDVGGWTEQRLVDRLGEGIRIQVQGVRERLTQAGCPVPAIEARARYGWIREMTAGCVERPTQRPVTWTDRIDRVLTHKVWGTLIFLALMFLVFQAIFTWARPLMKGISDGKEALADLLRDHLPAGPLTNLLLDGVLEGVGAVVVFLPQILILFAFIAILEDCGYMARAAFLMDKLMSRCGLSGKSFIPMLSSVACAVPGIMATRVIENRRDRLATILVAPLMSCSARLPVYILLIGAFLSGAGSPWWLPGVVMFLMYTLGLVIAPLVAPAAQTHAAARRNAGLRHGDAAVQDAVAASGAAPHVRQRLGVPASRRHADPRLDGRRLGTVVLPARRVGGADRMMSASLNLQKEGDDLKERRRRGSRRGRRSSKSTPSRPSGSSRATWVAWARRLSRWCGRWAGTGRSAWRRWRVFRPARW